MTANRTTEFPVLAAAALTDVPPSPLQHGHSVKDQLRHLRLRRVEDLIPLTNWALAQHLVAWNIATPGSTHEELRYHWRLLDAGALKPEQLYGEIIPAHWGKIPDCRLAERWSCSDDHIAALIEAGALTAITAAERSPAGSPLITRASAIAFLEARIQ